MTGFTKQLESDLRRGMLQNRYRRVLGLGKFGRDNDANRQAVLEAFRALVKSRHPDSPLTDETVSDYRYTLQDLRRAKDFLIKWLDDNG